MPRKTDDLFNEEEFGSIEELKRRIPNASPELQSRLQDWLDYRRTQEEKARKRAVEVTTKRVRKKKVPRSLKIARRYIVRTRKDRLGRIHYINKKTGLFVSRQVWLTREKRILRQLSQRRRGKR